MPPGLTWQELRTLAARGAISKLFNAAQVVLG